MKLNKLITGLLLVTLTSQAQNTKTVLGPDAVMELVRKNHPLAKQAFLLINRAEAEMMSARGGFDPVFELEADRKIFDGKNYYYHTNPELQIPTPLAITVKTGFENNGGDNLFSENTKGRSGYLGIELPLGNGLLIDKRRAALQQAKIFGKQSEQEKRKIINDLMLDAYNGYWQWAGAYRVYQIYSGFIVNAENRLKLVKNAYLNGDRSVMDTVESFTQLQQYRLLQSEAQLKLNNTALELSNFLWLPGDSAYAFTDNVIPDTVQFAAAITVPPLDELITRSNLLNPTLQAAGFKVNSLETEKRLKFQGMLPYVSLKANILTKDYQPYNGWETGYIENNYKWGIGFSMPLLIRQGRGEYKKAQIKLKESQLELANKRRQTENKIRYHYNEVIQLNQQLQLLNQMQTNYRTLLRNEELKLIQGESSLFLVNSRETKILELLEKKTALTVKYLSSHFKLKWAAGLLQ